MNNGIGAWRISHKGEAVIVNAGLSCIENKQGEGDFSLSLQELKDLINANPQATQYHKDKLSVITLAMVVNSKRLDDLGKIETRQKIITLNDTKRDWLDDFPETGQDLLTKQYKSRAWTIEWLKILTGENNADEI